MKKRVREGCKSAVTLQSVSRLARGQLRLWHHHGQPLRDLPVAMPVFGLVITQRRRALIIHCQFLGAQSLLVSTTFILRRHLTTASQVQSEAH